MRETLRRFRPASPAIADFLSWSTDPAARSRLRASDRGSSNAARVFGDHRRPRRSASTTRPRRLLTGLRWANYFAARRDDAPIRPSIAPAEQLGLRRQPCWPQRFNSGFEQICHRLTTLAATETARAGVPFFMLRVRQCGQRLQSDFPPGTFSIFEISAAPGPLWNVHSTLRHHARTRLLKQVIELPDGTRYFPRSRRWCAGRWAPHPQPANRASR